MLLDTINTPQDIKALSPEQLSQLCGEIRTYMTECCSKNPGHLASSLGAVEIIVGLHYIYNTPEDKIIFDVGHQAYAHKILTQRKEAFKELRTGKGISGFPRMEESPYDAFGAGHSSTSISAALGYAEAFKIRGLQNKAIAVIGDGALTGGLAWEGLNNAGANDTDLLVILNDNNHSIDDNTGSIHNYLLKITTSSRYNRIKSKVWDRLGEGGLRNRLQKLVINTKSNLVRKSGGAVFEALGFRYFGPIDGNDIDQVRETLARLKNLKGPRILHCITKKGKGYGPAEADPTTWHAPGKFDPVSGERKLSKYPADRYQDVFGQSLCDLAALDPLITGITPAMASGCGMNIFAKEYPSRFFDVGIEEEHAVTFSAGLAAGGLKPFCNIYSAFSQRAYDEIIHDVALQNLPVVLCFDRAGLVGEDGATHHGAFDMAAYRSIPGAIVAVPRNELELRNMMYSASLTKSGPYIIRYPRGCGEGVKWRDESFERLPEGRGICLKKGEKVAILALGHCANRAVEAAQELNNKGICNPAVYDMRYLKPMDEELLDKILESFSCILTVEDGCLKGGLYSAVGEYVLSKGSEVKVGACGIPDEFIRHDSQKEQRKLCRIDAEGIFDSVIELIEKK